MRSHIWLLAVSLLLMASCRARQGQPAIVADPFLSGRSTVPPPPTATVSPLGTIQPYDTTAPILPPNGVTLPPGTPIQPGYPPVNSGTMSTPSNGGSGVRFAGGAASSGGVQLTDGNVEPGQATTAGWTTPIVTPTSATPPRTVPSTDILNLPPVRR